VEADTKRGVVVALVALGAACSSPPAVRHHSLLPPPDATASAPAASALAWELMPVGVPAQVDRPQWVVRTADGSLALLEQERWIAPLADEFGAALGEALARRLGPPAPGDPQAWRVAVDVQRLDSVPGRLARLDASWSVLPPGAPALRCAFRSEQTVDGGAPALAAGHRRAVAALAASIADALVAAAGGRAAACPR
jgi:uncharacterized lipoprotein YmbA